MNLFFSPIFLIVFCMMMGSFLGNISFRKFKLGSSMSLFIGLFISFFINKNNLSEINIPNELFNVVLIGFIASVGLKASKNIRTIISTHGIKFIMLSFFITAVGASCTFLFIKLYPDLAFSIIGAYEGGLTSSPGLATALEISQSKLADASIGLGYSIAYVPGILVVMFYSSWIGKRNSSALKSKSKPIDSTIKYPFHIWKFLFVVVTGLIIGNFKIKISSFMVFSLGITGGVLISALFLGSYFKSLQFENTALDVIRDISLNGFLAIVGLDYGYTAINAVMDSGVVLLIIGLAIASISVIAGHIMGYYILKIEPVYLVGGICGGMTSTPGLACAVEAFESEDVTLGYGAAYPFALVGMILWTNILISISFYIGF